MTRDDKSIVFTATAALTPVAAWLATAGWQYGFDRPFSRALIEVAKRTPHDELLLGSLLAGAAGGLLLGDYLVRRFDTKFGGAGFKRFLRGTEMVSHRTLQKATREGAEAQVFVADTPIPT